MSVQRTLLLFDHLQAILDGLWVFLSLPILSISFRGRIVLQILELVLLIREWWFIQLWRTMEYKHWIAITALCGVFDSVRTVRGLYLLEMMGQSKCIWDRKEFLVFVRIDLPLGWEISYVPHLSPHDKIQSLFGSERRMKCSHVVLVWGSISLKRLHPSIVAMWWYIHRRLRQMEDCLWPNSGSWVLSTMFYTI